MTRTVMESINAGLLQALEADPRVVLLGEDILDPYGGAFKATRGCSTRFPEQVLTTPISEACLVGMASGMALRGMLPVVEIMFGDFLPLAADALINHAAKFSSMYNHAAHTPLVVRTPMGGRRGYGPTHSQTMEKYFLGVPDLTTIAPAAFDLLGSTPGDAGYLLQTAILDFESPVLFVENKLQYLLPLQGRDDLQEFDIDIIDDAGGDNPRLPVYRLAVTGAPAPAITLAAYGYMASLAQQAVLRLAYEHEIFVELVVPTRLAPFSLEPLWERVAQTKTLVTVEEGGLSLGWGAEVCARAAERISGCRVGRVAALDAQVPASPALEAAVLPDVDSIIRYIEKMV